MIFACSLPIVVTNLNEDEAIAINRCVKEVRACWMRNDSNIETLIDELFLQIDQTLLHFIILRKDDVTDLRVHPNRVLVLC